jgi:serine/threonine protein kinase
LQEFLRKCLDKNPNTRATAADLISDPWVTRNGAEPIANLSVEGIEIGSTEIESAITKVRIEVSMFALVRLHRKAVNLRKKRLARLAIP